MITYWNLSTFINYKMAEHDMKLPDTILAFKLLDGAGLNEAQRQH